jgi:hypothetical protein
MDLSAKQIDEKPKRVGILKGKPIYHLRTKGGLHLLVTPGGSGFETLGTGPHRAVARHIAQKHEPDIVWDALAKSDHVDIEAFALVLPKYEVITDYLREKGLNVS